MNSPGEKKSVLFICTHNSARSQMAEGILNAKHGDRYQAFSAGTEPSAVNPFAVQSMKEIGIDISSHRSKSVAEFIGQSFELVVTVCDSAKEACPFFPGAKNIIHKCFPDPGEARGSNDEILAVFRQVRDEIQAWIEDNID